MKLNNLLVIFSAMSLLTGCGGNAVDSTSTIEPSPIETYTVTWLNDNGDVLEIDNNVIEGMTPEYNSDTPTKQKTSQFSYLFAGWSPKLSPVICDVVYTAMYTVNDDKITYSYNSGSYYADISEVTILDYYDDGYHGILPVSGVISNVFENKKNLTKVTMGKNIEYIGNNAFSGCTSLSKISVENNINYIGQNAFYNTTFYNEENNWNNQILYLKSKDQSVSYLLKAKTAIINPSIKDNTILAAASSFNACTSLLNVVLPNSIKYINEYSFNGCSALVNATLSDELVSLGADAFNDCTSLKKVTIGNKIEFMGEKVFYNTAFYNDFVNGSDDALYLTSHDESTLYLIKANQELTAFSLKEGTVLIASLAFSSGNKLTNFTCTPSLRYISNNAFDSCLFTSITLNEGLLSINDNAFFGCSNLESISLPDSLKYLGEHAFFDCYSLKWVDIGKGLDNIGYGIFTKCKELSNINVDKENKCYEIIKGCLVNKNNNGVVAGINGSIDLSDENIAIIMSDAFSGLDGLHSIILPDSLLIIESMAFYNCSNLIKVDLGNNITAIGDDAFADCNLLSSIVIPKSVKAISTNAFEDCDLLSIFVEKENIPLTYVTGWNVGREDYTYLYSETINTDGHHWHYVNDVPTIWAA